MARSSLVKLYVQQRDIALLRGLFECRVMKIDHVASLYFAGRYEYAKKRLQKLKSEKLLAELPRVPFEPSVLYLTSRGLHLLKSNGILSLYPKLDIGDFTRRARVSRMTLRHELAIVDLKVVFYATARRRNISVTDFITWPRINQFKVVGEIVKPDAFICIQQSMHNGRSQENRFYLELDRSTESLATLCAKARAYAAHNKAGYTPKFNGCPSVERHSTRPFRVLFVLRSVERRDNLARRLLTLTPPILSLVWLATFADAAADPFNPIWARPSNYRGIPSRRSNQSETVGVFTAIHANEEDVK